MSSDNFVDASVKIALSLYKVQQNIYLLDFQKVEVNNISILTFCLNDKELIIFYYISMYNFLSNTFSIHKYCASSVLYY